MSTLPDIDVKYGYVTPHTCQDVTGRHPSKIFIFLDGVKVEDVISADDTKGEVLVYKRKDGKFYIDDPVQGLLATEMLRGAVEYAFK